MAGDGLSATTRRRRTVTLPNGRVIELETIGMRDYAQVREQACADYKRQMIQTWSKNVDLLPESERDGAVLRAFDKAEKITPDDLPTKTVTDPETSRERKVAYADWWMGMTVPGLTYSVWLSMRKCPGQSSLTIQDVEKMFEENMEALNEVGDQLADLSKPRLGNHDPAATEAGTALPTKA